MLDIQEMQDKDEDDTKKDKFLVLRKDSAGDFYCKLISSLNELELRDAAVIIARNATERDKRVAHNTLIGINEFN